MKFENVIIYIHSFGVLKPSKAEPSQSIVSNDVSLKLLNKSVSNSVRNTLLRFMTVLVFSFKFETVCLQELTKPLYSLCSMNFFGTWNQMNSFS